MDSIETAFGKVMLGSVVPTLLLSDLKDAVPELPSATTPPPTDPVQEPQPAAKAA
jgi:hypothetical protein